MNQALIGELMKAKTLEGERETYNDLLKMRTEIVRDVIEELKERAEE